MTLFIGKWNIQYCSQARGCSSSSPSLKMRYYLFTSWFSVVWKCFFVYISCLLLESWYKVRKLLVMKWALIRIIFFSVVCLFLKPDSFNLYGESGVLTYFLGVISDVTSYMMFVCVSIRFHWKMWTV